MKILFDLFPIILFFITYKLTSHGSDSACLASNGSNTSILHEPILLATSVAIAATFLQVGWLLLRGKKVDAMLWISLTVITVFGSATLYFHNAAFIQAKPTILYWTFAIALSFSSLFFKENLIKKTMGAEITLPDHVWANLNIAWILFFVLQGIANLVAVKMLSCNDWVSYKAYGSIGFMLIFVIGQTLAISKYIVEKDTE